MKRILPLLAALLLLALLPITASAHPGSLDVNGGHWDHSDWTYHYHKGLNTTGTNNGGGSSSTIDEKYKEGYSKGYEKGYAEGKEYGKGVGRTKGFSEGKQEGYQEGLVAGRKEGDQQSSNASWKAYTISAICFAIIFIIYKMDWDTQVGILKKETHACAEVIAKLKDEKAVLQKNLNSKDSQTEQKLSQQKKLLEIEAGAHCWDFHTRLKFCYGSRYMYDMAGAPANAYLDKSYRPHTRNVEMNGRDDQYAFYVSHSKGRYLKYHTESCRHANHYRIVNAYDIRRNPIFSRCLVCNPVLPPTEWVDNLKELYQFIDKYEKPIEAEATPLPNPRIRYSLREHND